MTDRFEAPGITLLKGDCLDLMEDLEVGSVDMVFADPPYGTTASKWDSPINFSMMWWNVHNAVKKNGAIVMTASQPFTSALVMSSVRHHHQSLCWKKNKASGHLNAKSRHMTGHEDIVIFCRGKPIYNPQKWQSTPANAATRTKFSNVYNTQRGTKYEGGNTDRYPTTVLSFNVINNDGSNGGRLHAAQKPVDLVEHFIKTYTNEGETVMDFTMGSGTTGIACINTNRKFIGIEKDPDIFNIALERIKDAL